MYIRINKSQFHYGSIKTEKEGVKIVRNLESQFHYGSIKTLAETQNVIGFVKSLNSTMVRLKRRSK